MDTPAHSQLLSEDVLTGENLLRKAFAETARISAERGSVLAIDAGRPPILLINRGALYRSMTAADGRRVIIDIFLPTDVVGIDDAITGGLGTELVAASPISFRAIPSESLRELISNPGIAARLFALLAEQRGRMDRHALILSRFDARERICAFVLGIYDRLRRAELIFRPTFNLPLTQEQLADHLGLTTVHVSRTLRGLREEKVLLVDRQVTIIINLDKLREIASGSRTHKQPRSIQAQSS